MACAPSYTRKQWLIICSLMAVTLSSSLCASLQAPFYPQEAELKGATATEYGLVFGIFELVAFICCPLLGKYMGKLGVGLVLKCGIITTGLSTVLFGLLHLVEGHWTFLSLSFILRSVEAVGVSAISTASMSIVVMVFEESFARVFTILEVLQGLGYMLGPTIGGYLYEVGGFILPFAGVGSFVLAGGLFVLISLPRLDKAEINKPQAQIMVFLRLVPLLLDACCLMVQAMSIGFISATLEPHLRQFNLSPTALGSMFVIGGGVYLIVAPIVGILCDKQYNTRKMIMLACPINIISIMLIGPMPYTPLNTSLWMVAVGLVADGLGMSFIFVPAFVDAIRSAIKYGLPDDISTYAVVSGIYGSSFALGAFIGPSVAGALFDAVGFRKGSLFVMATFLVLFIAMSLFLHYEKRYEKSRGIVSENGSDESKMAADSTETQALNAESREDAAVRRASLVKMNGESTNRISAVDKRSSVTDASESERRPLNSKEVTPTDIV